MLVRDLQRLSDADSACRHTGRGLVSARPITGQQPSVSCRSRGAAVESTERLLQVAASTTPQSQDPLAPFLPPFLPSVPTFLSSLPSSSPFLSYFPSLFFQHSLFLPSPLLTSSPFIPPSLPPTLSSHFLSCVLAYILFFLLLSLIPPSFLFPSFSHIPSFFLSLPSFICFRLSYSLFISFFPRVLPLLHAAPSSPSFPLFLSSIPLSAVDGVMEWWRSGGGGAEREDTDWGAAAEISISFC